jgi:hypothetical protein
MSVERKDKTDSYPAIRRRWLAWMLANGETFEERSSAGHWMRCIKAGRESVKRQRALGCLIWNGHGPQTVGSITPCRC